MTTHSAHVQEVLTRALKRITRDERGLNTAELLGNAALAIVALVAIWAALQALGINIIGMIESAVTAAL